MMKGGGDFSVEFSFKMLDRLRCFQREALVSVYDEVLTSSHLPHCFSGCLDDLRPAAAAHFCFLKLFLLLRLLQRWFRVIFSFLAFFFSLSHLGMVLFVVGLCVSLC